MKKVYIGKIVEHARLFCHILLERNLCDNPN